MVLGVTLLLLESLLAGMSGAYTQVLEEWCSLKQYLHRVIDFARPV